MRKGTPNQFIAELENKIADLKGVQSSAEVIDDGEDVIEAGVIGDAVSKVEDFLTHSSSKVESDEDIEVNETVVDVDPAAANEAIVDDHADYLDGVYQGVEDALEDMLEEVSWSHDEENIYLDVSFDDGHIVTFTIPRADLVYDLDNPDTDIEYICKAIREDREDASEPEDLGSDEYYDEDTKVDPEFLMDEYDIPAYL